MGEIIHKGIVRKTVDGKLEVTLIDGLECESCHIKGACNIGETRDNNVRMLEEHEGFEAGEEVSVHLSNELAFSALFWAYIFPFIVLFGALIILSLFMSELYAALIALGFLVVYYFFVYINKNYFNRKFSLKINKLKHD